MPEYKSPKATVGAIIKREKDGKIEVLLTKRQIAPFKDQWCLPGGYVDENEPIETAIKREVLEETGLTFEPVFFRGFDDIFPEKKIHNVVNIFVGEGTGQIVPQASEVKEIKWFPLAEACALPLAFAHNEVVAVFQAQLQGKPSRDELLAQYDALRAEVLARMEMRQQLLTIAVAGAGIFSAIVTGEIALPIFLLLFPPLGLCLAIAWSHHDVRAGEIGEYIRLHIEPHLRSLQWEQYMRDTYTGKKNISKYLAENASLGTFIGTEVAAMILALLFQIPSISLMTPPNSDLYYVLFLIFFTLDLFVVRYTFVFIRERRRRYEKSVA